MQNEDFISFSRKSRRGAIVFLFAFILIAIIPRIYGLLFVEETTIKRESISKLEKKQGHQKRQDAASPSTLNPNTASIEEWKEFGFSEKQAQSIINYKNKIGGFNSPDELKKSFVIDDEKFEELLPYLSLHNKEQQKDKASPSEKEAPKIIDDVDSSTVEELDTLEPEIKKLDVIDINSASFEKLVSINGIGEYFAEKIIDQRIKRGGFTNLEQLLEIYYFEEENLDQIKDYIKVDEEKIDKFDLNSVTLKRLSRHPDITWEMARSIIDLREELRQFESLDQLLLSAHIDLRRFKKIKPYFKIESK